MQESTLISNARGLIHVIFTLDEIVIAHPLFQRISKTSLHVARFLNRKEFTALVHASFFFTITYSYKNWFLNNTRKKLIFFLVFFVVGIALNLFVLTQL
tara:strand:- start:679 stop:975 length:297 start_codon:yes stop_codon:yes gene_type:complete